MANALSDKERALVEAYWRAASYLSIGRGQGVGIVIPNRLTYPGSIVCTDIKDENYTITRRHRKKFGQVYALDTIHPEHSDST
jgi:type IV secretion system protein VirD4